MGLKRERHVKLNNKGLTLVEVVIAMCILSVAITGMVTVLVTSVRFNAKANLRQHATLTAESILENFKAYDVKTLCEQFHAGSFSGVNMDVMGTMGVRGKSVPGGVADEDLFIGGSFTESSTKEYEFSLTNIKTENALYDATITVTPYMTEQSLVTLEDMHPYKDAVYRSSEVHDTKARDQILTMFDTTIKTEMKDYLNTIDQKITTYTETDIVSSFATHIQPKKRVTTITLDKDDAGYTTAVINMDYYFIIKDYPYYLSSTEATPTGKQTFPVDYDTTGNMYMVQVILDIPYGLYYLNFYKNPNTVDLEKVYFYYYPAYDVADEIKVVTHDFAAGDSIDMYILKQVPLGADATLNNKEASYNPTIQGESIIKLYHNFGDNIGGSSVPPAPTISGFASSSHYMEATIFEKQYQLMYNMDVEVREAGTTNVVAALSGTKND